MIHLRWQAVVLFLSWTWSRSQQHFQTPLVLLRLFLMLSDMLVSGTALINCMTLEWGGCQKPFLRPTDVFIAFQCSPKRTQQMFPSSEVYFYITDDDDRCGLHNVFSGGCPFVHTTSVCSSYSRKCDLSGKSQGISLKLAFRLKRTD